jgi:hypothetical protein
MRLAIHRISPKTPSDTWQYFQEHPSFSRVACSFFLTRYAVINVVIIRAGTYNSAIQGKEVKSRKNSKMKNASWKIAIVFSVCALPLATTKGELTTKDYWTVQAPPRRQEGLHYRYKKLREECLESDSPRGTCLALFQTCDLAPHHHHLAE